MDKILNAIIEIVNNLAVFFGAFSAESEQSLYCRGMVFGLHGSKLMMKVANIVFKPNGKAHEGKKGEPKSMSDYMKNAMANVGDTIHDTIKSEASGEGDKRTDEL